MMDTKKLKLLLPSTVLSILSVTLLNGCRFNEGGNAKKYNFSAPVSEKLMWKPDDALMQNCKAVGFSMSQPESKKSFVTLNVTKQRKWNKNLLEAATYTKGAIPKKFKRRFEAIIYWESKEGDKCQSYADIRMTGDGNDHIRFNDGSIISSLDVKLRSSNLDGLISFKLLLPEARMGGDAEIFTATLMRELGYASPRTYKRKIVFNGNTYLAIVQENATKNLLESQGIRETAILETNEKIYWDRAKLKLGEKWKYLSPRLLNTSWAFSNLNSKHISLDAMKLFSAGTEELRSLNLDSDLSDIILSAGVKSTFEHLSSFRVIMMALGATHGLKNHNRRFYYDALTKSLKPIYYDGNPKILLESWKHRKWKNYDRIRLRDITSTSIDKSLQLISSIDIKSLKEKLQGNGVKLSTQQISYILDDLKIKINSINKFKSQQVDLNKFITNKKWDMRGYGLGYIVSPQYIKLCRGISSNCDLIENNILTLKSLLKGKISSNGTTYIYASEVGRSKAKVPNVYSAFAEKSQLGETQMIYLGKPAITIDQVEKILKIQISKETDKVILKGGLLKDWKIQVFAPVNNKTENSEEAGSRFDRNLLTGALTFVDIELNDISVDMRGGLLEDSINFIRSNGTIKKIRVSNSHQDAIDIDFSNLYIHRIQITNAGNDCLDVSGGSQIIDWINLSGCEDKAISAGEEANLSVISGGKISDSTIALASKDSSQLKIRNMDITNIKHCYAAYRKKQEFDGAFLYFERSICPETSINYTQSGSIVESF